MLVSCAALLGSWCRKNVIAHIKSSLPPLHTQRFFITTSGQNPLCFPNILTTGSSSNTLTFHSALAHLLYQYQVKQGLSITSIITSTAFSTRQLYLKGCSSNSWPSLTLLSLCYMELQKSAHRSQWETPFQKKMGAIYTFYKKTSSPDTQIAPDLI